MTPDQGAESMSAPVDPKAAEMWIAGLGMALVEMKDSEIAALRAEVERLRVQNIQMQAALGYGIMAEDERHILPSNPFKCGTCDANKHIRAENERLARSLNMNCGRSTTTA